MRLACRLWAQQFAVSYVFFVHVETSYHTTPLNATGVIFACIRTAAPPSFGTHCADRKPSLECALEARKFDHKWNPTLPWLWYDAVCVLMSFATCCACVQLGHSVPFVQRKSNFRVWTL